MSTAPGVTTRNRRRLAVVAFVTAIAFLFLVVVSGVVAMWVRADTSTAGTVNFARPLVIPPLANSAIDAGGRRVFDLRLQAGSTDFGLGRPTATWGINGSYLGPTLRAKRGERVAINVTNDVGEVTSLHWHGMHLPAEMDGGPHQMIQPRTTWRPSWKIHQPAATLWYHPHLHGKTAKHVYRGLAGMFILDDSSMPRDLPNAYGTDDVPVIVQDKSFTSDGQLDDRQPLFSPTGFLGGTVLVNGTVAPYHNVTTEKVRLRLLNASNARIYSFGLVDPAGRQRGFALVGTDGGLLTRPVDTGGIQLSPGERAEIIVSMSPGENLVLRSRPADLGADFWNQRFAGGDDTLDILQLRAGDTLSTTPQLPERLAPAPDLKEADAVITRKVALDGSGINGRDMDMSRIDEVVTVGTTEVWRVSNGGGGSPHSFHVHDVQFVILDVDGAAPAPPLRGWKDTVYIPPNSSVRLLMRFADYTDPDSPYMFHCHLLRHEDQGMMGQFVVVKPGQRAGQPHSHTPPN